MLTKMKTHKKYIDEECGRGHDDAGDSCGCRHGHDEDDSCRRGHGDAEGECGSSDGHGADSGCGHGGHDEDDSCRRGHGDADDSCGCGHNDSHGADSGCGHGDAGDSCGCGGNHSYGGTGRNTALIRLAAGAAVFAAAILSKYVFGADIYIQLALYITAYLTFGGGVLLRAVINISKGRVFDENFLMGVATIGAIAIGEYFEAVAVMLFYQVGMYCQSMAVRKSKKSITKLMDIRPDYANVKRNGEITAEAPEAVGIGEHIIVKPGEKIPLDGLVIDGTGYLDTKSLTGESAPRPVQPGDTALSGFVSQNALLTVEVTKPYGESTVAKIIGLVENAAGKKAPTENFITKFSRYYTPVVVILAALLAFVPPLVTGGDWAEWINRGLIFLVISCPCALVISIPLSFFGGIGGASRNGILVKGGNYLEALNNLDIVVFDKTGTLTRGVFEVSHIHAANGYSETQVLELAAFAEHFSNHPIAHSIIKSYGKPIDINIIDEYMEMPGYGVSVTLDGNKILAGNKKFLETHNIHTAPQETEKQNASPEDFGTVVYIAKDGGLVGYIVIADDVKHDSRIAVAGLKSKGVRNVAMLTGDNAVLSKRTASELDIKDAYSDLLPHEKNEIIEQLMKTKRPKGKLAFIGDGINDAPALAGADIGVAMGGLGSDAAIEAADIVLMTDEPSRLITAMDIAKATRRIVWQNITLALGVKAIVLLLGALGAATMWAAVFADVGVALLAVLNATRILKTRYYPHESELPA